jgi:hypothetical protein
MSLLDRADAWLAGKLAAAGGVSVVYERGPKKAAVTAAPGDQQVAAVRLGQVNPAASSWVERDYLVAVSALAAAGFDLPPQVGDRITETVNGEAVTFELMRPAGAGGKPCWAWSGAGRTVVRLHAKRV